MSLTEKDRQVLAMLKAQMQCAAKHEDNIVKMMQQEDEPPVPENQAEEEKND